MSITLATRPELPFLGKIPKPIVNGDKVIRIIGILYPYAQRFIINLQATSEFDHLDEPIDDICLQIDVRLNDSDIILNHIKSRQKGHQEQSGHCPLKSGQPFEISIFIELESFKIEIDGKHHSYFDHRLPLDEVKYIYTCRDANIITISIESVEECCDTKL